MAMVTAVGNEKGGVGKTTVTLCLASELALMGRKVLLIDLDQQRSAASTVGATGGVTIEDVLSKKDPVSIADAIQKSDWAGVDVIAGSDSINSLDRDVDGMVAFRLQQAFQRETHILDWYDDVLIDLPPAVATATVTGLLAADRVVAVTEPEPYSSEGLSNFIDLLTRIASGPRPHLRLHGVLVNKIRRAKEHVYRVDELHRAFGEGVVLAPMIPLRVVMSAVGSEQQPLHELKAVGAKEMSALFRQHALLLVEREGKG